MKDWKENASEEALGWEANFSDCFQLCQLATMAETTCHNK
jgi:hypothetical protein